MRGKFGVLLLLLVLLGYLQYHFWLGGGSSGEVVALEQQVEQQKENEGLQQRNAALAAEVEDLKSGEAAVEERARSELGMIKPGETFYRVVGNVSPPAPALERCTGANKAATMIRGVWAVVPAAGRGTRFGGATPKQYLDVDGKPLLAHTLDALLAHPQVAGAMVVIGADDADWPGWSEFNGKPVRTVIGGTTRAASVLNGVNALPESVRADDFVLVHDAARPNLVQDDVQKLLDKGREDLVGAILAAPVRDTLKRAGDDGGIDATESRSRLWRAFTPQMFRRLQLVRALEDAAKAGVEATDEAMAMERLGLRPLLVEGSEDNFKITTPADLARFRFILSQRTGANA